VGAGGKLVGYAGGLERKRFLLGLESPVPQGEFALGGERVTARA
jgi:hypothetical protein